MTTYIHGINFATAIIQVNMICKRMNTTTYNYATLFISKILRFVHFYVIEKHSNLSFWLKGTFRLIIISFGKVFNWKWNQNRWLAYQSRANRKEWLKISNVWLHERESCFYWNYSKKYIYNDILNIINIEMSLLLYVYIKSDHARIKCITFSSNINNEYCKVFLQQNSITLVIC